jgi:hypothetical protein
MQKTYLSFIRPYLTVSRIPRVVLLAEGHFHFREVMARIWAYRMFRQRFESGRCLEIVVG